MELNYFREFLMLASTGSYSDAAENLFIAQSTLSKHIKNMEDELAFDLFTRSTRKVELTDFGTRFLPYAERIVSLQNEYSRELLSPNGNTGTSITLGVLDCTKPSLLSLTSRFHKNFPEYTLNILEIDSIESKTALRTKRCDFAFVKGEPEGDESDLTKICIQSIHYVLALPKNHKFAKYKTVPLSALRNERFLFPAESSLMYQFFANKCRNAGFEPIIAFSGDLHIVEGEFIKDGFGIAFIDESEKDQDRFKDVAIVATDPDLVTKSWLYYRAGEKFSGAGKALFDTIKNEYGFD